jgi:hypothetical protein
VICTGKTIIGSTAFKAALDYHEGHEDQEAPQKGN